jgi:HlyD family secretion protein
MTRYALLLIAVVLVVVLGWAIDSQSRIPTERNQCATPDVTICASGRIEGRTEEIELRPRLLGRVASVRVEEGQMVAKDDVLVALDDAEYRHEVALAAAELRLAEARLERLVNGARREERDEAQSLAEAKRSELEAAELSWKRVEQLRKKETISQQEADDARTRVAALRSELAAAQARVQLLDAPARADEVSMHRAQIEAARARLELANVQLERTKLRAPCEAQILRVDVEAGELASPESPEPTIILVDTSRYRVRALVEEMDAPRVRPGMNATVYADGMPECELRGKVARSSPRMTRKQLYTDDPAERYDTKTREVWIDLEPCPPLVVGLRVDVVITPANPRP